jgi:DNA-directed RNA polymerase subunit beta'
VLQPYIVPVRAHINVEDGELVKPGTVVAKMPRDVGKTRDITGGLPRVTELFEARSPQQPAVISDIDGIVSFDKP